MRSYTACVLFFLSTPGLATAESDFALEAGMAAAAPIGESADALSLSAAIRLGGQWRITPKLALVGAFRWVLPNAKSGVDGDVNAFIGSAAARYSSGTGLPDWLVAYVEGGIAVERIRVERSGENRTSTDLGALLGTGVTIAVASRLAVQIGFEWMPRLTDVPTHGWFASHAGLLARF